MNTYSFKDISNSVDRHKIYLISTTVAALTEQLSILENQCIAVINIGRELACFLDDLDDYRYLSMEVQDFIIRLLDKSKIKIDASGNPMVAIYNLGILFEPDLELDVDFLFRQFSKSTALIILWENQIEQNNVLNWPTQKNKYFLDFSNIQLKRLQCNINN